MDDPDVAAAIPALVESGALPAGEAPRLLRVARGELLSVHRELRALLYAGVLLATGGVGLLVKQNLERIGPLVIAAALAVAAAAALAWVVRVAPPFSWQQVESPNLAFDYILLLGILLVASDLAYVELHFGLLGAYLSWHLLIVAVLAGAAAVRFDSRVLFSLALSSFAAWRGVSLARARSAEWFLAGPAVRWNAIACGVLFAALGYGLARTGRKAHFEPVAVHLGWLLVLCGLAAGMTHGGGSGLAWGAALLLVGALLAAAAYRLRRFPLFAYGVVAAYIAVNRILLEAIFGDALGCLWIGASSLVVVAGLLVAYRRLKEAG